MKSRGRQKNNQLRDPNEPVKPPKPYIRYSRSVWEKVSNENPGMNIGQIGNTVGRLWRNLADEDKEIFNEEFKEDMIKYENELRTYYKSVGYKEWLKRNEENNRVKIKESPKKQTLKLEKMAIDKEMLSENSYLQPDMDSDEDLDLFDIKMESSNRFYRNHTLMLELFSETRIPSRPECNSLEESCNDIQSQIDEVQSHMTKIYSNHLNRLSEINERSEHFQYLMQLENDKMQSLIAAPKLCD